MENLVPVKQDSLAAGAEGQLKELLQLPSWHVTFLVSWTQVSSLHLPVLFLCFADPGTAR